MEILLKNAHVVDPSSGIDSKSDILISGGKITDIKNNIKPDKKYRVLDVAESIVMPSLLDIHAHLRTPGREDEETLLSGAKAALKGGFTNICCMPNTEPVLDNAGLVRSIIDTAKEDGIIDIYPIGAITKNREGKQLTEMHDLKEAGAVAFSDDGSSINDSHVMRRALEYANMLDMPIISHCEDNTLASGGQINEGYVSTILGLKGIPKETEVLFVARDISLAKLTGAHLHIAHVSCKESLDLIRLAKKEGVRISCETAPQYFSLTDEDLLGFDTNMKVNPPLRTKKDVDAIIKALSDGTIDVIASDHAPHSIQEKELEFDKAPFGMIGLQTSLPIAISKLIKTKALDWGELIKLMSVNPAGIIKKDPYIIKKGEEANLIVVKMKEWAPSKDDIVSLSCNSAFLGKSLTGVIDYVFNKGKLLLENQKINLS